MPHPAPRAARFLWADPFPVAYYRAANKVCTFAGPPSKPPAGAHDRRIGCVCAQHFRELVTIQGGILGSGVHPTDLGAKHNTGTDFYVAVSKLFLAQSLFLNGTIRFTQANQLGLLGFGGERNDSYKPEFEGSVAYLLTRKIAIGVDYRTKPHNLNLDNEKDAFDLFVAWAPTKNVSVVAAYLNLGKILDGPAGYSSTQQGPYVSLQVGF